ncbi:nuclear localization protein [Sarocladium strictum]
MAPRNKIRLRLTRRAQPAESTPKSFHDVDGDDETMLDVNDDGSVHEEPADEPEEDQDDDDDDADADDTRLEGSGDEDGEEGEEKNNGSGANSVKAPTPPPSEPVYRRKRLGRPPKNKPPGWDPMITITKEEHDALTPRRRGRGGWRGRGGRKGGPAAAKAEQVIDAEGTVAEIVDDECVLPEDPEGEKKVDKLGNLEDGREYRCRTFTVLGRGNRLYMLSTEPARCVGFRDSYLFFTKHRKLYKIIVDDDEKKDMIEREIIPHSYKGRSIGIVTARSVFREFGARIVVGGKRVIDDYAVALAKSQGVQEGVLADPDDKFIPGQPYNKNQYVAWHGASAVYHTQAPAAPIANGKPESKKRKVNVNDTNWMLEHAREASVFNAGINAIRKMNNAGVYDIHTNTMQYPAIMQPTRARVEQIAPEDEEARAAGSELFTPVPHKLSRNFAVMDTSYESGGYGSAAAKTDTTDFLATFNGLESVPAEIRNLLPEECRRAFDGAVSKDREWQSKWGTEEQMMARRAPVIDKAIVPYSMS